MAKDKAIFFALNEMVTPNKYLLVMLNLSVVGSRMVQLDDGHFNDVLFVLSLSVTFYQCIKSLIHVKEKL
jgi:hypothetical protein